MNRPIARPLGVPARLGNLRESSNRAGQSPIARTFRLFRDFMVSAAQRLPARPAAATNVLRRKTTKDTKHTRGGFVFPSCSSCPSWFNPHLERASGHQRHPCRTTSQSPMTCGIGRVKSSRDAQKKTVSSTDSSMASLCPCFICVPSVAAPLPNTFFAAHRETNYR